MADVKDIKSNLPPKTGVLHPHEKADLCNAVEAYIKTRQLMISRTPDQAVKDAMQLQVSRLQALFVKIRQEF